MSAGGGAATGSPRLSEWDAPRSEAWSTPPVSGSLLLISPHLDDVVLSAFALLARAEPVDVLTVFTGQPDPAQRTGWDAVCGFEDSTASISSRLEENRVAFEGWPHRLYELDLLDQQYRSGPVGEQGANRLRGWVSDWIDRQDAGGTVVIPAGAGLPVPRVGPWRRFRQAVRSWHSRAGRGSSFDPGMSPAPYVPEVPQAHPDHEFVRDTLGALLLERGTTTLVYEEVPYLWGEPGDGSVAQLCRRVGMTARESRVEVDRDAKAARVRAYRSQIPVLYAPQGRLDSPQGLPGHERFWTLSHTHQGTSAQLKPL